MNKCFINLHGVSNEAKNELRRTKKDQITYCIICGQKLLLTMHETRPNSFYIDPIGEDI